MYRCVKACDLLHIRKRLSGRTDSVQVVWVVQGREPAAFIYFPLDNVIDSHRFTERLSSMDHAMAYRIDLFHFVEGSVFILEK